MVKSQYYNSRKGRRCRGNAASEFAIALPFLLLLMVGSAELGRMMYSYITLDKAVRASARYVADHALDGSTGLILISADVASSARNLVVYGAPAIGDGEPLLDGLSGNDVTVQAIDNIHLQVTASYQFTPLFSHIPTFGFTQQDISLEVTLNSAVTMRALR